MGVSRKSGVLFWGPYMRDPIVLGSRLGAPEILETPMCSF